MALSGLLNPAESCRLGLDRSRLLNNIGGLGLLGASSNDLGDVGVLGNDLVVRRGHGTGGHDGSEEGGEMHLDCLSLKLTELMCCG